MKFLAAPAPVVMHGGMGGLAPIALLGAQGDRRPG
jgi:hypothetical protein